MRTESVPAPEKNRRFEVSVRIREFTTAGFVGRTWELFRDTTEDFVERIPGHPVPQALLREWAISELFTEDDLRQLQEVLRAHSNLSLIHI